MEEKDAKEFQSNCKVLKKTKRLLMVQQRVTIVTLTPHRLRSCVALMIAFRQFQEERTSLCGA